MTLYIKNGNVWAPELLGIKDLIVANGQILDMDSLWSVPNNARTIDASGLHVVPGFIDQHIHITGAGGKDGYASMTKEFSAQELLQAGTTTVVGLLGTDGSARSLQSVYAKAKALSSEGVNGYMYTGYYGIDPVHLMSSAKEDLMFIDNVLGCKVAISDIRSSFPTDLELVRLLRDVRVGGMLAGKKGIVHLHLGNLPERMDALFRIVHDYGFPIKHISPTHVARTESLFEHAIEFAKLGGSIDITTGASKYTEPHVAVLRAIEEGVPEQLITFSTDGNAGLTHFDSEGHADGTRPADPRSNLWEFQNLVRSGHVNPATALKLVTSNPADNLGLKHIGRILSGAQADLLFFDDQWILQHVVSKGEVRVFDGKVVYNTNLKDNE